VNVSAFKNRLVRAMLAAPVLGSLALGVSSCASDTIREGRGSSYLIINALEGSSGCDKESEFTTVLRSDVLCKGIAEDNGRVTMRIALKDIGGPSNPVQPTTNNYITLSRYRVVYRRSDGRNQPGVDVPYPFDGGVTGNVTVAPAEAVFSLVRVQSKLEAPLKALVGLGGAVVISTLADVTFYGRDQAGNEVSVTGTISVNFADWADPE
jgi:hypothetical protein